MTAHAVQTAQSLPLQGICLTGDFSIASAHGMGMPAIAIVIPDGELSLVTGVAHEGPTPLRNTPRASKKAPICRAKYRANMGGFYTPRRRQSRMGSWSKLAETSEHLCELAKVGAMRARRTRMSLGEPRPAESRDA